MQGAQLMKMAPYTLTMVLKVDSHRKLLIRTMDSSGRFLPRPPTPPLLVMGPDG